MCDGALGFYDCLVLSYRSSSWELMDTLGLSVLLVVPSTGACVTLVALIPGLVNFRQNGPVSGILLSDCSE
jgi:Cobyrinic acid a,c-diamide synthase